MNTDFEDRLRKMLAAEQPSVVVDEQAVLARGRSSVRIRHAGQAALGVAILAVAVPVASLLAARPDASIAPGISPAATSTAAQTSPSRTAWRLSTLTGDWVGTEPVITLVIDGDKISGDLGCGNYQADIVETATSWRLNRFSVVPCPYPSNSPVPRFLNVLEAVTTADRTAERLTLSGPEGALVFEWR
jgi:hypothetical protein